MDRRGDEKGRLSPAPKGLREQATCQGQGKVECFISWAGWVWQWLANLFYVKVSQSHWERAPPSSRIEFRLSAHQSIAVLGPRQRTGRFHSGGTETDSFLFSIMLSLP